MNWKNLLLAAFGITAIGLLSSCTGFETASSGEVIRNPSVDDMDRLHEQWGMQRRQVKPRYRPAMPSDFMNESSSRSTGAPDSTPAAAPAPALQEPAPEPIPSPTPAPEVPAPPTTPAPPIPDTLR
ncbi:hypothetical protein [Roseimicrobium sp. ORNL1]|uniref:hypothetical protein n=1 Tax=Roseimicrobium sp. ORNL1 TaxID=2711231 RepID=UPI001980530F|nr:hypothetical protein [Roseimicrobium sp. ORNL1]